jgi:hypothetical protein
MMRGVFGRRERGQMMVLAAILFPALLGITGVAIDLGFGYAHRRQVQNAADAAALAGTAALGRHWIVLAYTNAVPPLTAYLDGMSDPGDAGILQEVQAAAAANVQPFPSPASTPSWPTGPGNSLTAYYILTNGTTPATYTVGPQVGSGAVPANAVGVRVEARLRHSTFFARLLGACCEAVSVGASARSLLYPLASQGGAPFIVCGGTSDGAYGAWAVADKYGNPVTSYRNQLFAQNVSPPTLDYATWAGTTFRVHDEKIGQRGQSGVAADCGAGPSYKGNADPNDTCDPIGATQLPCWLAGQNGDRAGPTRNRVNGLNGCGKNQGNNCKAVLPVANGAAGYQFRVVTYACFQLFQVGANSHNGMLLPACAADGEIDVLRGFDPNNPGAFTWKLAPDS